MKYIKNQFHVFWLFNVTTKIWKNDYVACIRFLLDTADIDVY